MMKETDILQLCRIAASEMGAIVWRNNCGAYKDIKGQWVKYGVASPGGSDLIGIYRGRFLAMEVKRPGKRATNDQVKFLNAVHLAGGISGVVTCPEDVKKLLTSSYSSL